MLESLAPIDSTPTVRSPRVREEPRFRRAIHHEQVVDRSGEPAASA
jgi:hypothetical protein